MLTHTRLSLFQAMKRKKFIKTILGTSIFIGMDGFSSIVNAFAGTPQPASLAEIATFGVVHLNNTSLEKATEFWTKIVGMQLRNITKEVAEFGTETQTLVVVHQTAQKSYQEGYSGLYHFAIHAPDKHEFAKMLYRLMVNNYPCSPTDHTMTQSVYLTDFDGITIEFALETPERFKRVITKGGLRMEGTDGVIRSASTPLDVEAVLKHLQDKDISKVIHKDSKIGHIHFYAADVTASNTFYQQLGFQEFNYLPQFLYADVGAGGIYQHRVAMNAWHGQNRPLAPKENAGLRHYQIIFASQEKLAQALKAVTLYEEKEDGFWVSDPTGNVLLLTHQSFTSK